MMFWASFKGDRSWLYKNCIFQDCNSSCFFYTKVTIKTVKSNSFAKMFVYVRMNLLNNVNMRRKRDTGVTNDLFYT